MAQLRTNPNDVVRRQILQYFYERNRAATSVFGKKGSAVRISDVKRDLKAMQGLTQQQVIANLTYLTDRQWVKVVEQAKSVTTRAGTSIPSVVSFYQITALGIEKIEGASEFQPPDRYPGINIHASGANVITLGDGNVVNARHQDLFQRLGELKEAISESGSLLEEAKLDAAVDIETLKDQLAKQEPDGGVIGRLWPRVSKAADLAGVASLALAVAPLIQPLIR